MTEDEKRKHDLYSCDGHCYRSDGMCNRVDFCPETRNTEFLGTLWSIIIDFIVVLLIGIALSYIIK